MHYYEVLFKTAPIPLTYRSEANIPLGSLIQVKLRNKQQNGIIITKADKPSDPRLAERCSPIQRVCIEQALSDLQLELCQWLSSYYCASFQRCVQLFIPSVIWNQGKQPKKEQIISLATDLKTARETCKRAKKQLLLLDHFKENNTLPQTLLRETFSGAIINALIKKGILKRTEGKLINPDQHHLSKPHHQQALTKEQEAALEEILKKPRNQRSLRSTPPTPLLLHGITGSGKTEVYLQLIKKVVEKNQQALLLVPEIALTTELIQHFTEHFPDQLSIIHSKLSEGERLQTWHRIHQGETKLILGSRSALFSPWKNLGAIIIDEEHEWTYKQESSPRYEAKTVAKKIAELSKSPLQLLFGSATPSLESFYEAQQTQSILSMTQRTNGSQLPPVKIVDLRDEYRKKNFSMFSDTLREAIKKRLEKGEQTILFLNKRGSASSITCRDCGYTPHCQNCDISLTYHARIRDFDQGGLICHYCGLFQDNLSSCPTCGSKAIRHLGAGTQKAEQQLQEIFPEARTLRADKDTTGGKKDFENIYHQMRRGEADILLGTQMIAKGLDLPNVTLTGIIIADIGLHIPDFRASERVFQLLTQVAGRSGRHKPGQVIIQTYQPDHPAIQFAKQHDYDGFYKQEKSIREQFFYPPFSKMIKLIYAHEEAKEASAQAHHLHEELKQKLESTTYNLHLDLAPHFIRKLHNKYIWNLFIRGENPLEILRGVQLPMGWKIDVDPR